jgi:hypothetical protein
VYQDIATARSKRESAQLEETGDCPTPGFVAPVGRARSQIVRAAAAMASSSEAATMRAIVSKKAWGSVSKGRYVPSTGIGLTRIR